MIPPAYLAETVTIKRRVSTGRDSLNNPVYGEPTTGDGWSTIYSAMPVRLAFSSKSVRFAPEGERILPNGIMYWNVGYDLKAEDRVLTALGIEYVVIAVTVGRVIAGLIDHYEATLQLP